MCVCECLYGLFVDIFGQRLVWVSPNVISQACSKVVVDELLNSLKKAALSGRKCSRWTFPAPPHAFSLTTRTSPSTVIKYTV